ncbi:ATP-binding cassette domain-containing protein [Jiella endophytica]|uniref:ATP-binding cassette domain-containing protein n=1 Tax=Jiella endophytica TaxID=2558362 RepID=A0A4Y8RML7_9HYPH|nr:oligopeptide/dipeptide ABC transporter ATP-binding protein [Jiella endophytica]TFF24809.1 ATP-binding cassette domain-containing protein [Jiella endophytica]
MTAPLLEVRNLTKTYRTGGGLFGRERAAHVVDDVSFVIEKGATFGLVGESGSGKTTIGRLVLRLVEANGGSLLLDGEEIGEKSDAEMRRLRQRMQIIFQDPFASLDPRVKVGEAIAAPIRLHRLRPRRDVRDRVVELLELVGLGAHQADRFPHEFSGGQRQRIAIARALAVEPELIVCDEAVSALDLSIQAQVINLLADLRDRLGVSYLFISHDMAVIRHVATHVGVLYAGRLVETGEAKEVFGNPRHPYTRMLLAASPSPVPGDARQRQAIAGEPPSPYERAPGCRFASRCPSAIDACRSEQPPLSTFSRGSHQAACIRAEEFDRLTLLSDEEARMSPAYRLRIDLLRRARAESRAT